MSEVRVVKYEWRVYKKAGVQTLLRDGLFVGEVRHGSDGWMGTTMQTAEVTGATKKSSWGKHSASSREEAVALTEAAAREFFGDTLEKEEMALA